MAAARAISLPPPPHQTSAGARHINSLPFVLCVLRKREKRKLSAFHHPHKNFIAECVLRQLI
jgi:hypothetical protein